ncbi:hypothetical protein ACSDR0_43900 [Streptosporangium sp. G11]|uniref:hypothetical protein n=1 Tax=Streptosporangium sp. G11 TaxID=3436926 RepID=UPI003EBD055A
MAYEPFSSAEILNGMAPSKVLGEPSTRPATRSARSRSAAASIRPPPAISQRFVTTAERAREHGAGRT